jgi:hypothetical protein
VLLFWEQEDLKKELEAFGWKVYQIHCTNNAALFIKIRRRIDAFYFAKYMKTPTTKLRQKHRYASFPFKKKIKFIINKIEQLTYNTADYENDKKLLSELIQQTQAWQEINQILLSEKVEHVFTTAPFLESEDWVCRAAQYQQIPIYYSVLSFDNPTTRGYMPFVPEKVSVWNKNNKEQLIRVWGDTVANKIDIIGPPQFDFYFNNSFIIEESTWRKTKQIENHRPVIMYGANAKYFVPDEYKIVKLIDDAIESGQIRNNPIILIRPHPTDSFKDWEVFTQSLKHTIIERSIEKNQSEVELNNKYSNFTLSDVKNLCSTLSHTAVHISFASTLVLDGICFNKPQICPYFSPSPQILSHQIVRNLYHTEHYLPITQSGAVAMPKNENDLIDAINQSLAAPDNLISERNKLKQFYLNNTTGECTTKLATSFSNYLLSRIS